MSDPINNESLFVIDDEQTDLYNEIYGAPIFDDYDDEEPIFTVHNEADLNSKTYGGGESIYDRDAFIDNLAVLGFGYFGKNIQVAKSRITKDICWVVGVMDDSRFALSQRNNKPFKEFVDASHVEVFIKFHWIQNRADSHKLFMFCVEP